MHLEISDPATGATVGTGAILRPVAGGRAWRLEGPVEHRGEHHLRCSQSHPRMGRVTRVFHPSAFGLVITVSVEFYRDRARLARTLHEVATQAVLLTVGGLIAWFLAEYGNTHWHYLLAFFGASE